tara:strand:+ start:1105 stop:1770 length:666 start_codon:yes stop_codon:yes gene_type:complete
MGKELNFITSIHKATKRNYLKRMNDEKVKSMKIARKYSKDYWDGNRKYGYGGYKFIPGYWTKVAKKIIKKYKLSNNSKILDIGCGKGFLLYEIKSILKNINIVGIDISSYAILNSKKEIKKYLFKHDIRKKLPFKKNSFDLIISLGCLHNLNINNLISALNDINRVSKKSYIMVESYRNEFELFNLQCWALTCNSFFKKVEWEWLFSKYNKNGDYEFIYFL